jgi:hypothetical protein
MPSRAVRERGRANRPSPPTAWEDGGNTVLQVRRRRWLRADTEMVCSEIRDHGALCRGWFIKDDET